MLETLANLAAGFSVALAPSILFYAFAGFIALSITLATGAFFAFLSPVLLRARPGASEPHYVEPFGPVSTVLTVRLSSSMTGDAAAG